MATVLDVLRSKSEPGDMREAALLWAARGFKVFPIVAGTKTPLVADFPTVATGDPDKVRALWTDPVMGEGWPLPHNVGVLTGGDLLVLDVDTKRGKPGLASLAALELGTPTLTIRTPTGGKHLYFRTDREVANSADHPGPGLDVRGRHGYVLAPGSAIDTGHYEIERDGPVAAAPLHFLARLAAARERADTTAPATDLDTPEAIERARDFLRTRAPAVEGQGGDDWTYRTAAIVKDLGLSAGMALDVLLDWNETNAPPWSVEELETKVENAFAYGLSAAGSQSPAVDLAGIEIIPPPSRAPAAAARVRFLSDADAAVRPSWLLKGWLPKQGVVLLAGQSRIGKTFLSLELAGALATGGSFFGRAVRERVGVLILAAEGGGTIAPRLEALRLHRLGGIDAATLPIAWAEISDANEIGAIVAAAAVEMQSRFGLRLGLVAVDTVAAAFGVDENDAQLATSAMKALGKLATEADVLVVAVAHYGKSDGAGVRGSSAWTASADVILAATGDISETTGEVKDRKLALTKSRFAETGPIADFDLHSVNLGLDEDGDPISAAVIGQASAVVMNGHQALYMDRFETLMHAAAEKMPDGRLGVRRELIRQYCYEEWTDATPKNRKQWFERAEKALLKQRRIDRAVAASGEDFAVLPLPVDPASLF